MGDELAQKMSQPGFDPEKFVHKVSNNGEKELQKMQKRVEKLATETAHGLKKNVYKNYSQFIETAKEISILEGEMYQLSHMLTDQKSVIHGLQEMSLIDKVEKAESPTDAYQEEDRQKNLAFLLEKVEGCASVMEVPGRYLVHSGDLVELDPENFSQVQKIHGFLLNDSLMFASWLPHRRGPVKYRFQSLCELAGLAVVNARDAGGCKNAFKILMFPDTRMFQAESTKEKRLWLDILDETKRKKTALDTQRKEAAQQAAQDRQSTASLDPSNPFAAPPSPLERQVSVLLAPDLLHVEWVQEVPEDLDVFIAQREFEAAVDLVEKVQLHLAGAARGAAAVKEYRQRIEARVKQLTDVLMHELQASPERAIRGGPRVARRAVTQLIRLGKSAQACSLFLKNRSAIIKYNLRQLKIEGHTTLYVKRLCSMFFENIQETAQEFIKAFPEHYGCFSGFIIWTKSELENFVNVFCTQVFGSKTNFSTVAECVHEAKCCCDKLSEIGLDMTFSLELMLASEIRKFIQDAGDVQSEAVKQRAAEDQCKSLYFGTPEAMEQFEEEMVERGVLDIHKYTYETSTYLTGNTYTFVRSYTKFCDDLLNIYIEPHQHMISRAFTEIFLQQLKHLEKCWKSEVYISQRQDIYENVRFMVTSLFPVIKDKYTDKVGLDLSGTEDIELIWHNMKANFKGRKS